MASCWSGTVLPPLGTDEINSLMQRMMTAAKCGSSEDLASVLTVMSQLLADRRVSPAFVTAMQRSSVAAAAERGQADIVRLLLEYQSMHCENHKLTRSPADSLDLLLTAGLNDHLDVVKILVQHGADVNSAYHTSGNSVLHTMCYSTRDAIVEYLISVGARTDSVNNAGETCLFSACWTGRVGIAGLLLDKGADPNHASASKYTPLHVAAAKDHRAVAELLLKHGAVFKDAEGLSPLTVASVHRSAKCFEYFLTLPAFSRQDKVDAMELMGAVFAPTDASKTYHYLKEAMVERHTNPAEILLKPKCAPVPELGDVVESQTLAELESRMQDSDVLQMESLLAAERILGPGHTEVGRLYLALIRCRLKGRRFHDGVILWKYARKSRTWPQLQEKYDIAIASIFGKMLRKKSPPFFTDFLHVLQLGVVELEMQASTGKRLVSDTQGRLSACTYFLWGALQVVSTEEEWRALREWTGRLIAVEPSHGQCSVLHHAIRITRESLVENWTERRSSTFVSLVDFLVKCGADVNRRDERANTPLHLIVKDQLLHHFIRDQLSCQGFVQTVCSVADVLLKAEAHVDASNNYNQTPLTLTSKEEVKAILLEYYPRQ